MHDQCECSRLRGDTPILFFYYCHNLSYFSRWQNTQVKNTIPSFAVWRWQHDAVLDNEIHVEVSVLDTQGSSLGESQAQLAYAFHLAFPLPPVCTSIIVSETTQTESIRQACDEAETWGIVPVTLWHCHTSPGFSTFWPLIIWKQTSRSLYATLSSVFCYV